MARYRPKQAHWKAQERAKRPGPRRFTEAVRLDAEKRLLEGWTPEIISARARLEGRAWVCKETIYKHVYAEAKAGGAYPAINKGRTAARPALTRFRRTFIWVAGAYVLVLDDIRAAQAVDLTWLLQGPRLTADAAHPERFTLAREADTCAVVLRADGLFETAIRESPADHRGKPLGWQQLQATLKTPAARFASVYALWGGTPELTLDTTAPNAVVRVRRDGGEDVWTWTAAPDNATPATLRLRRADGREQAFGPDDRTPAP